LKAVTALLCFVMLAICCMATAAPVDVPKDHWAYDCVSKLAAKGLVSGYPDGSFLGNKVLTRYEMACLVSRILDQIDQRCGQQGSGATQSAGCVTKADLQCVQKLVEEFKVELTVMGTRLDKVECSISNLESKVEDVNSKVDNLHTIVTDEEGPLESTRADVKKLKVFTSSGFLQTRYVTENWQTQAQSPQTFIVQRARWKLTAQPNDTSRGVLSLDLGQNGVAAKDAYYQYIYKGNERTQPSFFIGQMNWPFGYDVPTGDDVREAPERSLIAYRLFPGERDQGAKIASGYKGPFFWQVGAFNGRGTKFNTTSGNINGADFDNNKAVIVDVKQRFGDLDLGASYYGGVGVFNSNQSAFLSNVGRVRYGANMQWYLDKLTFKGEFFAGKGIDTEAATWNPGKAIDGYYAQLAYNLSQKNTLVGRFQAMTWDPVYPTFGGRNSWDVGVIHWLDSNSRLKLFYEINRRQYDIPSPNFSANGFDLEFLLKY